MVSREADSRKPRAAIFDLDGTLALLERDWADYGSLMTDTLCRDVHDAMIDCDLSEVDVIVLTGRPEAYRALTELWFERKGVTEVGLLLMRPPEDRRSNAEFKREMLTRFILPRYQVIFAVDDNRRTRQMFKEEGVLCYGVNFDGQIPQQRVKASKHLRRPERAEETGVV